MVRLQEEEEDVTFPSPCRACVDDPTNPTVTPADKTAALFTPGYIVPTLTDPLLTEGGPLGAH